MAILVTAMIACADPPPPADPAAHRGDVEEWRRGRYAQLQEPFGEEGWLALAGLHWLEPGQNSFGSGSENDVVFDVPSAPDRIGVFTVDDDGVFMTVAPGVPVRHVDSMVTGMHLTPADGPNPAVDLGSLRWYVISRNDRFAVRLKDSASTVRTGFDGIPAYPVDTVWRLHATIDWYRPPKAISVPNILGTISEQPSPGAVMFRIGGKRYRLDMTGDPDDEAFFITFGDETNEHGTYGGGRYVWIDAPGADGRTIIDFNKSYNPPCVFTPFATCPLPPRQNRLPVRVEAGELTYKSGS